MADVLAAVLLALILLLFAGFVVAFLVVVGWFLYAVVAVARGRRPGPATGGSCWRPSAAGAGDRAGAAGTSPGSPSSSTRAVLTRPGGSPDQPRCGTPACFALWPQ